MGSHAMRLIRFLSAAALCFALPGVSAVTSPLHATEFMPAAIAERLGLVESWNRSLSSPIGLQSISDIELYVHPTRPHQYLEVVTPVKSMMSADGSGTRSAMKDASMKDAAMMDGAMKDAAMMDSGPKMRVLSRVLVRPEPDEDAVVQPTTSNRLFSGGSSFRGMKEAQRVANNEIRRLKRRGIEATTRVVTSPRIGLFSIANDGSLEARNAETGKTLWTTRVGDSRMTYYQIGIADEHISVVNGGNLIIVDTDTGAVEQELVLGRTPIFGAVNAGDYAMVQGISGGVVCYPLSDLERDPFFESVEGYAITQPIQAPNSSKVAWSTDKGFVFVMEMEGTPSTLFRLHTDGIVTGRIAEASGERFFFGSDTGQVYAVQATREGIVQWSKPFGEPFYGHPIVYEDQLFIRSAYGNLYCLSTENGSELWETRASGVHSLIGVVDDKLYVRHNDESVFVLDRKTGEVLGDFPGLQPAKTIVNGLSDRLYFVSEAGGVQCLRPIDSELPKLNTQLAAINPEQAKASEMEMKAKPEKETKKAGGIFGDGPSGADPFGGKGADPFGGGAGGGDPFGGGGNDPFGGGDPFGN